MRYSKCFKISPIQKLRVVITKTTMKKIVSGILLLFFYTLNSCSSNNESEKSEPMDKVVDISTEDENLKQYKDTAQKQIDYLISFMNDHDKDDTLFQYFVKAPFIEGEETEHMWGMVNEFKDGYFIGILANDPNSLKKIKAGDPVKVLRTDVEDWILNDYLTNSKVGGFSQDYLHKESE